MAIFESVLGRNNLKRRVFGIKIAEIDQFWVKNGKKKPLMFKNYNEISEKHENDRKSRDLEKIRFYTHK